MNLAVLILSRGRSIRYSLKFLLTMLSASAIAVGLVISYERTQKKNTDLALKDIEALVKQDGGIIWIPGHGASDAFDRLIGTDGKISEIYISDVSCPGKLNMLTTLCSNLRHLESFFLSDSCAGNPADAYPQVGAFIYFSNINGEENGKWFQEFFDSQVKAERVVIESCSGLSDDAIAAACRMSGIRDITVEGCDGISGVGFSSNEDYSSQLVVSVQWCSRISDEGISALAKNKQISDLFLSFSCTEAPDLSLLLEAPNNLRVQIDILCDCTTDDCARIRREIDLLSQHFISFRYSL